MVGVSQSGQSPDIVSVLEEGRKQNCLTLAITNIPDSPLAKTADFVLDIQAGDEKAVAATKTYTKGDQVCYRLECRRIRCDVFYRFAPWNAKRYPQHE